ncbi:MAG TPA: FAD-binding oxidoreductase [Candidatus Dormibacteraeota bacterium]|nr:FAD-binding oxidoreductase [Candidatus Dormibacteraeota bacterium]
MGVKAESQAIPGQQISVEERQRLAVDGLLPTKIMHPGDAEDMARLLRLCDLTPAAVVVWGGGTQMRLGSAPARYDVAFSTERMTDLLEYEPADLTCRVEAGMRVAELQAQLAAQGQRLPLDPPHPERATVGGMVAANTSGLSRARYGTVRDWVIGIAVAYPSGKVARAGGKVVKNVAGYDLMKLHIGALGTLGVVAEVNLKVQARPEAAATLLGHFEAPAPAVEAGLRLARQYLAPASAVVVDRNALWACGLTADWRWTLALKLEGYRREVDAAKEVAARAIREAGGRTEGQDIPVGFWEAARDWSGAGDDQVLLRAIVPLNGEATIMAALPADGQLMAQPGAGIIEARLPAGSAAAVLTRLRAAAGPDGQVIVAAAPALVKQGLDVWGPPPPGFAIMRALKQALDPNGILNPERFVGGI